MYAIEEHQRRLTDGKEVTTYSRVIENANILYAEAGTTGLQGGDTGHGCRTYIAIRDLGGTDISAKTIDNGKGGFEVLLGGDAELATMIEALKFIIILRENPHPTLVGYRMNRLHRTLVRIKLYALEH